MTEKEILEKLIDLHKVDLLIVKYEDEKNSLLEQIKNLENKIQENQNIFNEKKNKLNEFMKKRAECELEIKDKQQEIKRKNDQVSMIKTNEAYKALQLEIKTIEDDIKKIEDNILGIMEEEEKVSRWLKEQEVLLKKDEKEILVEIENFKTQINKIEIEIANETNKRNEKIKNIDKRWLERYERIRAGKRLAMAEIIIKENNDGICGGCHFTIRPQAVIEVKKKTTIHTCDNCARIWYVEEVNNKTKV